jgi:hypothetical protein
MTGGATVKRLGPLSVTWRLAAVAAALAMLVVGQVQDNNDLFPFGSLSQYATARDPNSPVNSVYVLADTAHGEQVRVPLNPTGVGVGRAEIENQLDRVLADPSLLQALADAHAGLHPDQSPYTELYLMRDSYQLVNGRPTGEVSTTELATWTVRDEGTT